MSELIVEVVEVENIEAHPNADRLEIATVKGWQCVVAKGSFEKGQVGVYIPIDSVLPFEVESRIFGPESKVKLEKSRVRTIRLRGAVSQGLLVSLKTLGLPEDLKVGTDVKTSLGITKHEPPVKGSPQGAGKTGGFRKHQTNENFRKYTDLQHLKNYPNLFQDGEVVCVTEKIHGTNFRAGWVKSHANTIWKKILRFFGILPEYEFVYGSHNVQLQDKLRYKGFYKMDVYGEAVQKYNLRNIIRKGYVIYGEIYGDAIQKGYTYGCGSGERELAVFDIQKDGNYLNHSETVFWCHMWKLTPVPWLFTGKYTPEVMDMQYGHSALCSTQKIREGIVIKPEVEEQSYMGRKIAKIVSPDFLLDKNNTEFH